MAVRFANGACTVGALAARHARAKADAEFLILPDGAEAGGDRLVRWGELPAALADAAAMCEDLGARRGQPLAFLMGNGWTAVQILLGGMACGRAALPLNLAAGNAQLTYALRQSGCRALIADEENAQRARAIAGELPVRVAVVNRDAGLPHSADGAGAAGAGEGAFEMAPESRALLMYTSGTTGMPKGVAHSHATLLAGAGNVAAAHHLTAADRALCVLPLYHINALCVSLLSTLLIGASMVLPHRFRTAEFWELAARTRCTWFSVVPTLVAYLMQDASPPPDLSGLRFGRSASAPLAPELWRAFEARFGMPLIETMGLTETAAQILSNPLPPAPRKSGSPGMAFGNEVAVLADDGRLCGAGESGEIAVRGDNVMLEYHDNPDATAAAFGKDGWLLTGDLGHRDADGYFFVTGRRKELIIKGGENIAPREIDEALLQLPEVLDAAAFAQPCDRYGQRVEACVVLKDGAAADEAAMLAHCRAVVGDFKAPDRVYFVAELPRGASGKVQRLRLAAMVAR